MSDTLSDRERQILLKTVELYLKTGHPIGSRTLQKKFALTISPATIRNVMADLEDKGFLYQPHVSAGRIPTDKGLRIYIDHLLFSIGEGNAAVAQRLSDYLSSIGANGFEQILAEVLNFLTNFTGFMGLGVNFMLESLKISEVKLVGISGNKLLVVIVCQPDYVIHKVIDVKTDNRALLAKLSSELTRRFKNKSLSDMRRELIEQSRKLTDEFVKTTFELNSQIVKILNGVNNIRFSGAFNIVSVVADDFERLKETLRILEEKKILLDVFSKLKKSVSENLSVVLGSETNVEAFRPFCIVLSKYKFKGKDAGMIGIVGPKRMNYEKVIPVVENVSKAFSALLGKKTLDTF